MRRLACAVLAWTLLSFATSARADKRERPRPTITVTPEGRDLLVVVHDVTDYCSSPGETEIFRTSDAIRIVHDRPARSSCIVTQDLAFLVKDVVPGRYTITYERIPLVAPARPITVASTTAFVR
jgi:hypothetical protein